MHSEYKMKLATRNAFLIIGVLEASWAPMVPYVKRSFTLNEAQLGLLLLCTGLGSVLALPFAGPLCKRYGVKRTVYANGVLMAMALAAIAANVHLWLTSLMLVIFGMCTVLIDVSANVNGVILEKTFKKPLMSGFHGGYSLGTLIGAASMSLLLTVGLHILPATLLVLVASLLYSFWGCQELLRKGEAAPSSHESRTTETKQRFYIPPLVLLVGLACFILYSSEGAVMSWSAVFVNQERGVDLRFAGYFFTAFAVFMATMRLGGNILVKRLGAQRLLIYGSILVFTGFFLVSFVPSLVATVIGFAMIGIGEANLVPQLMSYAGHLKGMSLEGIVSVITALGYSGILLGPVIIGFCAHTFGLPATFAFIGLIIGLMAFLFRYLFSRQTNQN